MVVTSLPGTPVRPVGSTVTLTCTVRLNNNSGVIDIPVTVNTELIGPNGFSENRMAQRMGSASTYTSTAMVSSFRRDQSGNYTCTATVSSRFSLNFVLSTSDSVTNMVTVGKKSHSVSYSFIKLFYTIIAKSYAHTPSQVSISLTMEQF